MDFFFFLLFMNTRRIVGSSCIWESFGYAWEMIKGYVYPWWRMQVSLRNIGPQQDATYTARPASWLRHFPWSNASHAPPLRSGRLVPSRFESQIIRRH